MSTFCFGGSLGAPAHREGASSSTIFLKSHSFPTFGLGRPVGSGGGGDRFQSLQTVHGQLKGAPGGQRAASIIASGLHPPLGGGVGAHFKSKYQEHQSLLGGGSTKCDSEGKTHSHLPNVKNRAEYYRGSLANHQ